MPIFYISWGKPSTDRYDTVVKPRENRVPIMMSEEEIAAIEEWRYQNRIGTRSDAIRRLCKIGLFIEEELEQAVDLSLEVLNGVTQ